MHSTFAAACTVAAAVRIGSGFWPAVINQHIQVGNFIYQQVRVIDPIKALKIANKQLAIDQLNM